MTLSIAIILYLVFCVLSGLCGSHRRMGFFGTFLLVALSHARAGAAAPDIDRPITH